jgi:hypothetical protein
MNLIVVPEVLRSQVELVVREILTDDHGGTANLTLAVARIAGAWSVEATGLDDPVLEAGYSDVIQTALLRALP